MDLSPPGPLKLRATVSNSGAGARRVLYKGDGWGGDTTAEDVPRPVTNSGTRRGQASRFFGRSQKSSFWVSPVVPELGPRLSVASRMPWELTKFVVWQDVALSTAVGALCT